MAARHTVPVPQLGEALTPDDPALTGFPVIVRADDVVSDDPGNSFLREFTRPVIDLRRRPIAERVTWMRRRLDAAWD